MNTLALDIGNSSVKALLFDGASDAPKEAVTADIRDEYTARNLVERVVAGRRLDTIGYCSVVPAVEAYFEPLWESDRYPRPHVIGPQTPLPFRVDYETPKSLGADRIAVVAGAWALREDPQFAERPMLVIDAGTATTIEVVDREGVYRGGPILAGPRLIRTALSRGTAQLPEVDLEVPVSPIGRSTQEALQSGIMYGYIDAVRGGVRRLLDEVGRDAQVVVTGGWSGLLCEHVSAITLVRPNLVLEGVALLSRASESG